MNVQVKSEGLSQLRNTIAIGIVFVLMVLTVSAWIAVDFGSSVAGGRELVSHTDYFSEDYRTARDRFRLSVAEAGGRVHSLPLAAKSPDGDDLTIDVGWFGAESPKRALLHVSGIHGVEAFAGSAIQLRLIEGLSAVPEDTAIVFVHVLNPYGMAWLRRFNENNVDLNRNFLAEGEEYEGSPDGYADLNEFLNPSQLSSIDLFTVRAGWLLLRHGRPVLEAAVVAGQYDYPEGLFFGGQELEQGGRVYKDFLVRRLGAVQRVFAIDIHTGLGAFGEDTLLVPDDRYERLRRLLGDRVEAFSAAENNVAYNIRGGHHEGVEEMLDGVDLDFVGQEFGTYGQVRVLGALRKENYFHNHGDRNLDSPYKTDLKDTFDPVDPIWRKKVLGRGQELFEQVMGLLAGAGPS